MKRMCVGKEVLPGARVNGPIFYSGGGSKLVPINGHFRGIA